MRYKHVDIVKSQTSRQLIYGRGAEGFVLEYAASDHPEVEQVGVA